MSSVAGHSRKKRPFNSDNHNHKYGGPEVQSFLSTPPYLFFSRHPQTKDFGGWMRKEMGAERKERVHVDGEKKIVLLGHRTHGVFYLL